MKPGRPGSATSKYTKITQDSDHSKKEKNAMKFSQTFSSGSNSFHEQHDQFKQYVTEKEKQEKYKHFKKLTPIPQKSVKAQDGKPREKPFQRKRTNEKVKIVQDKIQKEEELLSMSKGFAGKAKKKMDNLKGTKQKQTQENANNDKNIDFSGFTVTQRQVKGTKKQVRIVLKKDSKTNGTVQEKKAQISLKKQQQKKEETKKEQIQVHKKEQELRRNEIKELQRYVNKIQALNEECLTKQYDKMINANPSNVEDLQKIDLNQFLQEPTQQGYQLMVMNIQDFDKRLNTNEGQQESIDLEEIISSSQKQENKYKQQQSSQIDDQEYLDSMSASQLVQRNAFITDILKGNKISKKNISQLEQKEKSAVRMHKLQRQKTQQKNEDDVQLPEINMMKKQSQRMIQKNKIEAGGHIYRDCDYLSQEHQKRLQQLLQNDLEQSPFDCDYLQQMRRKRIDQGIRMYRQMSNAEQTGQILNQQSLPKDPDNKKKAQKRILTQKMKSVNERLGQVDKVPVTKEKVKSLLQQFQFTKHSQAFEQLKTQSRQRFEQNMQKLEQAENMLQHFQEKENMNQIINDIEEQYKELEMEIKRFTQTDAKQLKKMEQERLKRKLKELDKVQKQNLDLQNEIDKMETTRKEVEESMKIFQQLQRFQIPQLQCQGYSPNETEEDIDAIVTRKWKEQAREEISEVDTQS